MNKYFSVVLDKKISGVHFLNEDVAKAVKNIVQIFQFLCPEEDFPKAGKELGR